ncbi:recombinase family protein [Phenylobacterium sp. LH3H17]|nr:recombinase family protein [Phenylobacterium sp. LH3H17]
MEGRDALLELLGDVVGRQAGFTVILVLDVSRWGRFQDPDQAAHYEFICKAAGVRVEYCAEAFENEGSVMSALLKQFKRAMAAEFSRELSVKIAKVQRGLAAKGYRQGGPAGYGLRRQVVNEAGEPCGLLAKGEQKAVHSHRVILVPGPVEEVETVADLPAVRDRRHEHGGHRAPPQRGGLARGVQEPLDPSPRASGPR